MKNKFIKSPYWSNTNYNTRILKNINLYDDVSVNFFQEDIKNQLILKLVY